MTDAREAAEASVDEVDRHWDAFIATGEVTELRAAAKAAHAFVDNGGDPADTRAVRQARHEARRPL